ncbi:FISUMP domain-containing protein [Persicobacter psychrovividus]|uniref:Fibrobacter succinogenes major paralogous domain-containing protein n=1 Tax=Persicobacter psychrovividus TaxID=387638 RepID=A0ABM7VIQ2_9BACT|nr:hypothetical protein PEPS_31300 [Persicobacter psychrovividus]
MKIISINRLFAFLMASLFMVACSSETTEPDPIPEPPIEEPVEKITPSLHLELVEDYVRSTYPADNEQADLFTESDVVQFELHFEVEEGKEYAEMDDPQLFVTMGEEEKEIALTKEGDHYISAEITDLFKDQMLEVFALRAVAESTDANATEQETTTDAQIEIGKFGSMTLDTFGEYTDNHIYKTVKIGEQIWMAENLKMETETHDGIVYEDGDNGFAEIVNYAEAYGHAYHYDNDVVPLMTALKGTNWQVPTADQARKMFEALGGIAEEPGYWASNYPNIANDVLIDDEKYWAFESPFEGNNSSGLGLKGNGRSGIGHIPNRIQIYSLYQRLTIHLQQVNSEPRSIRAEENTIRVLGNASNNGGIRLIKE